MGGSILHSLWVEEAQLLFTCAEGGRFVGPLRTPDFFCVSFAAASSALSKLNGGSSSCSSPSFSSSVPAVSSSSLGAADGMKGQLQSDSSQSYSSTGVASREEGEDSRKSLSKKVKGQVFSRGCPPRNLILKVTSISS
jgi:hypothetical protein